jgi:Skp family chaperone for outer membrane proteins
MKKLIFVLCIVFTSTIAFAQGKTAYISTDEVFAKIPQVIIADSLVRKENERLSNVYKEREDELNDLVGLFMKDSINMNNEQKELKRKNLQGKVAGLSEFKKELEGDLEQYREKLYAPIREKVMSKIKEIIKAKGYTSCLYREGALFFPPTDDITKQVIIKMGGK